MSLGIRGSCILSLYEFTRTLGRSLLVRGSPLASLLFVNVVVVSAIFVSQENSPQRVLVKPLLRLGPKLMIVADHPSRLETNMMPVNSLVDLGETNRSLL